MKKILTSMVAILVLVCAVSACSSSDAAPEETQTIDLGTSGMTMDIPASYAAGDITAEDTDESQVAYYASEESLVDFDVYQWAKAEGETLESVAAAEAAEYGAEATAAEFNGVACMYYETVEESEGAEYQTATYIFENGDFFVEIVFWLDGNNAADEVNAMISTIAVVGSGEITEEGTEITLGTSSLKITTPVTYTAGDITEEDTAENQVAYYASEESKVDFDVYQWAKAEGETLESVAADEAAEYGAEAETMTVGDLTVMKYSAVEESEGTEYTTVTIIAEDGSDFVEVVFWLDGDDAEAFVNSIIDTLTR